jgi:uncharacterized protein YbjT (DUF2867 family)
MATSTHVFVAGATGYLGGYVVSELARRGYRVDGLSRSPAGAEQLVGRGARPVLAEATDVSSLDGHFDDVDVVVSCLGITRQKDGMSYEDVDYQANINLLRAAEQAGVQRFVYVSVFRGDELARTAMVGAKEKFVNALRASPIQSLVVRPTGFFSDMEEIFQMARSGRAWVFGKGDQLLNPIDGEDLAEVIADALEGPPDRIPGPEADLAVGGPEEFTFREIAELAFESIGVAPRISSVPMWAVRAAERVLPRVTPQSVYGPIQMFLAASQLEMIAPSFGHRQLADHYERLAASGDEAGSS